MPNIAQVLKEEIRRLAKKELKEAVAGIQQESKELKRQIRELRRQIEALERKSRSAIRHAEAQRKEEIKAAVEDVDRARISSASVRKLRDRLGLTQAQFAQLLGVTGQAVYQWERKDGKLQLRSKTKKALLAARKLGVREVRKLLEAGATLPIA